MAGPKSRTNLPEAAAAAQMILCHAMTHREQAGAGPWWCQTATSECVCNNKVRVREMRACFCVFRWVSVGIGVCDGVCDDVCDGV